jgi:ADP-ribose pyrophosphatase
MPLPPNEKEIQCSRHVIHEGKVITFVQDEIETIQGKPAIRDVILHPGGACVLPILPDERILLIRQFRYATNEFLWEFPAGKLDVTGESPEEAIKRELWEETGFQSSNWESHGYIYTAPGFCDERIYLFIAKHCVPAEEVPPQIEDEAIHTQAFHADEIRALVASHQIKDAKTLALLAFL